MIRFILIAILTVLFLPASATAQDPLPDYVIEKFGEPPTVPGRPLSEELQSAVQVAFVDSVEKSAWGEAQITALGAIAKSGDPRLAWIITDLMRFVSSPHLQVPLASAASQLLGKELPTRNHWGVITDHLMAWDIPAPPDYLRVKRAIFTGMVPGWDKIFVEGDIDWRHVSWGGVLIDDRAYDKTDERCNCIPAADNPQVSSAEDATWLKDDDIVFGIGINGEYRAYPRRIMEVREMVNDTLGGRDLGIPYCTLCGSAQAYFTDQLPAGIERPVLRTSGLLIRSNKVMYDVTRIRCSILSKAMRSRARWRKRNSSSSRPVSSPPTGERGRKDTLTRRCWSRRSPWAAISISATDATPTARSLRSAMWIRVCQCRKISSAC